MPRDHQLKVSIEHELAEKFKARCISRGVSMAERITQLLEAETRAKLARKDGLCLDTRKQRRGATLKAIAMLEAIKDREEVFLSNIPTNLQGGTGYEAAEQAIDALDQAICLLNDAF